MVTQVSDYNFDLKSWDEKVRLSVKKPKTRNIGVQPSEALNRSVAIGQSEREQKSVGVGSTKESVYSRPMHFRRKSHMIAGIYSDK